jgi:hypothetical protein
MVAPNDDWEEVRAPAAASGGDDWQEVPHAEEPSALASAGHGLTQGATFGFADELGAGLQAGMAFLTPGMDVADTYRQALSENRSNVSQAQAANPNAYGAANFAGGALAQGGAAVLTGGTSLGAQMGLGAAGGALQAVGDSKDLSLDTAADAIEGAAGGALGAGAGYGVGKGLGVLANKATGALGRFAEGRAAKAATDLVTKGAEEAGEVTASARGTYGQTVKSALADLRLAREALENPNTDAATREALESFLSSPEGQQLQANAYRNLSERIGGNLEHTESARALMQAAQESEGSRAADLASHYESNEYIGGQLADRAKRYGPRAAVGLVTGALGGNPFEGAAMGQIAGPAKDSLKRAALLPGVQKRVFSAVGKVARTLQVDPSKLGSFAGVLTSAAARGPDALNAAHFVLGNSNPEYQKHVEDLPGDDE